MTIACVQYNTGTWYYEISITRWVTIIRRAIATQKSTAVPLWDKAPLLVAPKFGTIF